MDAIWDTKNRVKNHYFRNNIVWCYTGPSNTKRWFPQKHDDILLYVKSDNAVFNPDDIRIDYKSLGIQHREAKQGGIGGKLTYENLEYYKERGKIPEDYWLESRDNMTPVGRSKSERLGYPTQKPRTLYERMILASSKEGDIIMDPFCGCGTSIDAAHTLKRNWIGIDLTILALDPMNRRLSTRHGLDMYKDYEMHGYPTNMQEVRKLVKDHKKHHDFSNWAVTRIGLKPTQNVGDGGKDGVGRIEIWNPKIMKSVSERMLAEVKTGKPSLGNVRDFCRTMDKENAKLGIFITIETITKGMKQEAQSMGNFEHNGVNYPRLQFWQVNDNYFDNPESINQIIKLPREWIRDPIPKSDRHFEDQQGVFDWNEEVKEPIDARKLSVDEIKLMLEEEEGMSKPVEIMKESNLNEEERNVFWQKLRKAMEP